MLIDYKNYIFWAATIVLNPFPDSEEYDLLPLGVYTEATRQVSKIACYKDAQSQAKKEYNSDWASGVSCYQSNIIQN